jgi:hypothetical protein
LLIEVTKPLPPSLAVVVLAASLAVLVLAPSLALLLFGPSDAPVAPTSEATEVTASAAMTDAAS